MVVLGDYLANGQYRNKIRKFFLGEWGIERSKVCVFRSFLRLCLVQWFGEGKGNGHGNGKGKGR